jgi:hypothetical protein
VYYINFGPHGPRAEKIKDGWQILGGLATCVAVSFTLFWGLRQFSMLPLCQMLMGSYTSPTKNNDPRMAGGYQ